MMSWFLVLVNCVHIASATQCTSVVIPEPYYSQMRCIQDGKAALEQGFRDFKCVQKGGEE